MKVDYPRKHFGNRNEHITKYCKGKKVLHIGPCDSPFAKVRFETRNDNNSFLYHEIDKVCNDQLGIDIEIDDIEFLNNQNFKNSRIIYFDMNKLGELEYVPDVIIFGEVIEHLMNIETAFSTLKSVMTSDTILCITTPNAYSIINFFNVLGNKEYLHSDHKVLFTYGYLENILNFNNLEVIEAGFTKLNYNKKNISFKFTLILLLTTLIANFRCGFSDTLLFFCRKK